MQSILRTSVLLAGAFLVLAGANAKASDANYMEVKVPFPFLVNGQTFPAGQYRVEEGGGLAFLRGENGNHAATFVMTIRDGGQDPAGAKPALTFTRHENQYRLSSVWEPGGAGWSVVER